MICHVLFTGRERANFPERMNASRYCRTIIETEETFSSDNLRMIVLRSDNKQVPAQAHNLYFHFRYNSIWREKFFLGFNMEDYFILRELQDRMTML